MKGKTLCIILFVSTIPFFGNWTAAGSEGRVEPGPDGLEYQLEISGHEKLTALKNNPLNQLSDFVSDGCSGGLSIGWEYLAGKIQKFEEIHGTKPPWEGCCVSHDRSYHAAGGRGISAVEGFELRKRADQLLKLCVQRTGAERSAELGSAYGASGEEIELLYEFISVLMYRAVRIGGLPCTGLSWRWGYGWPDCE